MSADSGAYFCNTTQKSQCNCMQAAVNTLCHAHLFSLHATARSPPHSGAPVIQISRVSTSRLAAVVWVVHDMELVKHLFDPVASCHACCGIYAHMYLLLQIFGR